MTRPGPPVELSGPLAPVADGFVARLTALGYVSTNATRDGRWRKVSVKVARLYRWPRGATAAVR